jgi:hypothetical protein
METIIQEKIEIAAELKSQILNLEERQVIVHVSTINLYNYNCTIRLWPTIFLFPKNSSKGCTLIESYNIAKYPEWQNLPPKSIHNFTLIFQGLPKDCEMFDIIEVIPEHGAFEVRNIKRNSYDVYKVTL